MPAFCGLLGIYNVKSSGKLLTNQSGKNPPYRSFFWLVDYWANSTRLSICYGKRK